MKVYAFIPSGGYTGGCCIVIANSPIEAYGVLANESQYNVEHTDLKHCTEITSLVPSDDVTEPTLVLNRFYIE